MDFVCPKCKGVLALLDNGVKRCPSGHSFDRAKEGYYNLFLGTGGTHGDNKDMVLSRRAFLSKGYYRPLAEALSHAVLEATPDGGTFLDSGCGEGYYTSIVLDSFEKENKNSNFLAYDISKDAVKLAAKACPRVSFCVASSYSMPLSDGSVDTVMNVFSPLAPDEVKRVLAPKGHFIFAFPKERHLFGLKSVLYDNPYLNRPEDTDLDGFSLIGSLDVDYTVTLGCAEDIKALFMMTPYAYRTPREGRERLYALNSLATEISFRILTYKKL